ncbi:MAG: hypothetical protein H0U42_06190 [Thermoleophilaceae bacterium]|nr:hypothetical protein [Thermoleophilaceae bacterium]
MRSLPIALAAVMALFSAPSAAAIPVLGSGPLENQPQFIGGPAKPRPVKAEKIPRHPFMARNGRSVIHSDAYQTDTHTVSGPLGRDIETRSTLQTAECASVTFDRRGRIVTVCVGLQGPRLVMMDPRTLEEIASFALPLRNPASLPSVFTDFSGGGYFYLDDRDRAVVPTTDGRILVIRETTAPGFRLERSYGVASELERAEGINSALPDWDGRLWFVGTRGTVGVVDPQSGSVNSTSLGEDIENSFAVDRNGGVYIVTDRALYRFDASRTGAPRVSWRETYANDGKQKPGQTDDASGTTPTLIGKRLVAITDNADPVAIDVFQRGRGVDGRRLVCRAPVFERGASATDQSLIAAGRSIIAENNHGYTGIAATMDGRTTQPGIERVDLDRDGRGCRRVWRSEVRAPSVVPKLSLANGLVYTYTKEPTSDGTDPWYLTALDYRTGRTVYRAYAGSGFGFNNNYAPVTIGPDGTAYVGVIGGLVSFRDGG